MRLASEIISSFSKGSMNVSASLKLVLRLDLRSSPSSMSSVSSGLEKCQKRRLEHSSWPRPSPLAGFSGPRFCDAQ